MTEMQSDFEDWLKEFRGDSPAKMPASLEYMAWQAWQKAWQASRAAVVVKLPNLLDGSPDNATYYDYMYRKIEMEKALDEAGISYE